MIRVLLVEDERIVREGLREILEAHDDLIVVGELDSGERIVEAVSTAEPDVVLMDLSMPRIDGVQATEILRRHANAPAVIVLTTFDTDVNILAALQRGAVGFLRKTTSTAALVAAVRAAAAGESVLSRGALQAIIARHAVVDPAGDAYPYPDLSERDAQLIRAVAEGMSNAEIAADLFLSETTVKSYISRLLTKLQLSNRVQLARLWWERRPDG